MMVWVLYLRYNWRRYILNRQYQSAKIIVSTLLLFIFPNYIIMPYVPTVWWTWPKAKWGRHHGTRALSWSRSPHSELLIGRSLWPYFLLLEIIFFSCGNLLKQVSVVKAISSHGLQPICRGVFYLTISWEIKGRLKRKPRASQQYHNGHGTGC